MRAILSSSPPQGRKKMKNRTMSFLLSSLLLCTLACQRRQAERPPAAQLTKAVIRFVDVDFESPIRVDCKGFTAYWGSDVDSVTIVDKPFLDSLSSMVSRLNRGNITPDDRIVVEMGFSDGHKRILCLTDGAIALDGQEMEFQAALLSLIQRRIYHHTH